MREKRDVRPRQTNRATEEVRAPEGIGSESSLPQSYGNPRRREQRSTRRCSRHRTSLFFLIFF